MKRIVTLIIVLILMFALAACTEREQEEYAAYEVHTLTADENGILTINVSGVTSTVGYYNYDVNGTTVQLLAMRDNEGKAHVAFNTCQSCSPSPKAYFLQKGELLECQNCKNLFSAYQVGIESGGCNPWPVESAQITDTEIKLPVESLEKMAQAFANWAGLKE